MCLLLALDDEAKIDMVQLALVVQLLHRREACDDWPLVVRCSSTVEIPARSENTRTMESASLCT